MTETAVDTFPGWYPDPKGQDDQRFWNGRDWTDQTRSAVPAAEFVPVASDKPTMSPETPAEASENGQGKVRIFGGPPPASTAMSTPDVLSGAQVDGAKGLSNGASRTPVSEKAATGTDGSASTESTATASLFAITASNGGSSSRPAVEVEEARLASSIDEDAQLLEAARTSPVVRLPATVPQRSSVPKLLLAAVPGLLIGGAIGWFAAQSADGATQPVAVTEVDGTALSDDTEATSTADMDTTSTAEATVLAAADALSDPEELAALGQQVDDLLAELNGATAEVDALIIERDNALEHNNVLQTWFTPEVRNNAEAAWSNELQRACDAEAAPTIENTNYTRRMELRGTHADLVTAVLVCRAEG